MINPEDETILDFRPSCTKEEAVAKMLGWMQGHIRQKNIRVTEHGVSAEQLPSLHRLDGSLQDQLIELREAARLEFIKAAETGAAFEVIQAKEETVNEVDNLIRKAASYLLDIDDELAKGDESDLRIDQSSTESFGSVYITLRSLDQWAINKYGVSVIAPLNKFVGQLPKNLTEERIDEEITSKDGLRPSTAKNLLTTFAFLVEAYAEIAATNYRKGNNSPNVAAIAKLLEKRAKGSDKTPPMDNQGWEAIKKRIDLAFRAKEEKLKGK